MYSNTYNVVLIHLFNVIYPFNGSIIQVVEALCLSDPLTTGFPATLPLKIRIIWSKLFIFKIYLKYLTDKVEHISCDTLNQFVDIKPMDEVSDI